MKIIITIILNKNWGYVYIFPCTSCLTFCEGSLLDSQTHSCQCECLCTVHIHMCKHTPASTHTQKIPYWAQAWQEKTGFSTEHCGKASLWLCRVQHEGLWYADVFGILGSWEAYSWITSILNLGCHCSISWSGWNSFMWPTGCLSHKLYMFGKVLIWTILVKIRIHVTEQIHFLHHLGWESKEWFWHPYVTYIYKVKKKFMLL